MFALFRVAVTLLFLMFVSMYGHAVLAQERPEEPVNPLRLSYIEGEVSFWRPGAPDWVKAQTNTPLAVGDELYVGADSDLELQMGSSAFIRVDDDTQLSIVNQGANFIQFRVVSGRISFDLRAIPTGYSLEVDTPNAVFTIDHPGYYRVDINAGVHFTTRRGGRATIIPAGGQAMHILPSEEVVVRGSTVARAETYVAPDLDRWDRWNYDRTEDMMDAISRRYLPDGIAGVSDLDHHGSWRVVPDYGPVWVPDEVPPGWAPYRYGRWIWDPYYQWTWVDDAPWGWAPFHYGRWAYLGGYWAWAPGPVARHPVYAPALVAFFNVGPNMSVGISSAGISWVALGWGEPVVPWWGRPGFIGKPWWGGWRGPRHEVREHANIRARNAIVATPYEHFGRGRMHDAPLHITQPHEMEPVRGALRVQPEPGSLVSGAPSGARPPEHMRSRPVVSIRPPSESKLPWQGKMPGPETRTAPEHRYVPAPKASPGEMLRPEFGSETGEERSRRAAPPRFEERRRAAEPAAPSGPPTGHPGTSQLATPAPGGSTQSPQHMMREAPPARATQEGEGLRKPVEPSSRAAPAEIRQQERAELPGKPANRVYSRKEKREKDRGAHREGERQHQERRHENGAPR